MAVPEIEDSYSYFEHILNNPGLSHIMYNIYDSLENKSDIKTLRLVSKASKEMADRTKNGLIIRVLSLERFLTQTSVYSDQLRDMVFVCAGEENEANLRLFESFMLEYFEDKHFSLQHPIKKAVFDENLAFLNLFFKIQNKINGPFFSNFSHLYSFSLNWAIECESSKVMKWLLSRCHFYNISMDKPYVLNDAPDAACEPTKLTTVDYFDNIHHFLEDSQENGRTFRFPISKLLNRPTRSPDLIQLKKQLKEQYRNMFAVEESKQ